MYAVHYFQHQVLDFYDYFSDAPFKTHLKCHLLYETSHHLNSYRLSRKEELPKWFTYHQFTFKIHHVLSKILLTFLLVVVFFTQKYSLSQGVIISYFISCAAHQQPLIDLFNHAFIQ